MATQGIFHICSPKHIVQSVNKIFMDCRCCRQLGAQQTGTSHQYIQITGSSRCWRQLPFLVVYQECDTSVVGRRPRTRIPYQPCHYH